MNSPEKRQYRMTARAESAAATGERILDAVIGLFWEKPADQIVLTAVAERAGVTVQTVLRRFGSKEGLLVAALERVESTTAERRQVPPDDPRKGVEVLVEYYEEQGRGVVRMLAAEDSSPRLADYVHRGREGHRNWCAQAFPKALSGLSGVARERRLAQIVAVCDVYTWKLLRLDSGLSRTQTQLAIEELLVPLLYDNSGGK